MAQRFSKKSVADLQAAVRRYNSMRTRFINQNHPTYEIPKADIQAVLKSAENTQQLRQEIKALNDLRKLTDFNLSQATEAKITIVELRTFNRLDRTMQRRYKQEIERLKIERREAEQLDNNQKVVEITQQIQNVQARANMKAGIKTARGYRGVLKKLKADKANLDKYKTLNPPEAEHPTQDHYIAALRAMGLTMLGAGAQIANKIQKMSASQWARFCAANPDSASLDYVYNFSVDAAAKLNQISAALGMSITSSELVSEGDYGEE